MTTLSKSRLIAYRQCPKRLWLSVHAPERANESETGNRMAMGIGAGEVARTLFPSGVLIHAGTIAEALQQSAQLVERKPKTPLFEATFCHKNVRVQVDILRPARGGFDIVEVKSSTEPKEYHTEDAAIQTWVCQQAGIAVKKTHLATLNKSFIYPGKQQYDGLFTFTDITSEVEALQKEVPRWVRAARKTLTTANAPEIEPGAQCHAPFACPYIDFCTEGLPQEKYPPELFGTRGTFATDLRKQGYTDIRKVPKSLLGECPKRLRIWRATRSGKAELDPAAGEYLQTLSYPRYYIDFETISLAVPIWKGTSPFQQIPFQWSCHKQSASGTMHHREFLDISGKDPSKQFLESLIKELGKRGCIFVYNQSFEAGRLKELAMRFPEYAEQVAAIIERMVDLLPLARDNYYHRDMRGSWSIKAVLPTIAPDLDYAQLSDVQDGKQAGVAYMEAINPVTTAARRNELWRAMVGYCKLDTEAMVRLVAFFEARY
ncbi:DUF2779 domain-containing protein [Chrysiogenes arsenatis]|uniref:DUF2779 domain-containing protein n=1 Tax=Chrysiogenes arsenatis TaxID=309797 RepID=UPI000412D166|nr:DUF2779 domain-containing protein [Chrysiogenes arsenatis]